MRIALGLITKFHRHDLVGLDLDRLRGIVKDIAILGAGLLDDERRAGGNVGNGESASAIGDELTFGVTNIIPIGVGDKKLNIGDGGVRYSIHLFDAHAAFGGHYETPASSQNCA